jgi:hypothetical protein
VIAKVIFLVVAASAALLSAVAAGGIITVAGYLAGMPSGSLIVVFATTSVAVFGAVIALVSVAANLFFPGSDASNSSGTRDGDTELSARNCQKHRELWAGRSWISLIYRPRHR